MALVWISELVKYLINGSYRTLFQLNNSSIAYVYMQSMYVQYIRILKLCTEKLSISFSSNEFIFIKETIKM